MSKKIERIQKIKNKLNDELEDIEKKIEIVYKKILDNIANSISNKDVRLIDKLNSRKNIIMKICDKLDEQFVHEVFWGKKN